MKKYFKSTIISLALLMGLSSCNDFLTHDPEDQLVIENYYTSATMIRANTAALYSAKEWLDFDQNFQWKFDMLSGDMFYTYDQEGQFYYGTFSSGNTYLREGWQGLYNVIAVANSIINDMPSAASANGVAQADINQGLAEARCVRGICYFLLSQYWGDVPIIENNSEMIASGNIQVPRNTRNSVYNFAERDLKYAASILPGTDSQPGRATKWTALGMLSKLYLTMASHKERNDRADLYQKAKDTAYEVIFNSGLPNPKTLDYSTLWDINSNNGPESLFAIQCMVYGYGYGNGRNCAWSRSSVIADQTWGAGKGPTISLQKLYEPGDKRAKWVFMANNYYYPNICKADGGYTYKIVDRDDAGTIIEDRNEMLAHIKKYVIGKSADVDGGVGPSQDAANNIYVLRLSDIYFVYAEAVLGLDASTSDATALQCINDVRERAGLLNGLRSITFTDILNERRREFAMESNNWFDVLRYYYRDPDAAVQYLNDMKRNLVYVQKDGVTVAQENSMDSYRIADGVDQGGLNTITLTKSSMIMPIPASVLTTSPQLANDPVEKEFKD